eukprot:TRINITY_DN3255_c0_g1_i4.p1 TRINITY_DN3255_c0_g1~~TRINITY_DN3255_c0_g1_i4.p1  ORF type:complete len:112 (+),score=18.66 TRINITY_DN3255_c0_g1_i4:65-400(+)
MCIRDSSNSSQVREKQNSLMIPNISIAPIGLGEVRLLERFSIKKDTISSDFDPSDLTQRWIFVAQHRCPNTFRCIYLDTFKSVSYTHLRAHETPEHLVCRLLLEKKKRLKP